MLRHQSRVQAHCKRLRSGRSDRLRFLHVPMLILLMLMDAGGSSSESLFLSQLKEPCLYRVQHQMEVCRDGGEQTDQQHMNLHGINRT